MGRKQLEEMAGSSDSESDAPAMVSNSGKKKFLHQKSTKLAEEISSDGMYGNIAETESDRPNIPLRFLREGHVTVPLLQKQKAVKKEEAPQNFQDQYKKKSNKRPREASSKVQVSRHRDVYELKKKKHRDPRFDERAGEMREFCFHNHYEFLDDIRKEEKKDLQKELRECKKAGDEVKAAKITKTINQYVSRENATKERKIREAAMQDIRQENIERMQNGLHPVYKTKAQVRQKMQEKKFEQLRADKKLNKYVEKKAKKTAQKEKRRGKEELESINQRINDFSSQYGYV